MLYSVGIMHCPAWAVDSPDNVAILDRATPAGNKEVK
jgi:hypothetical protein